MTALDLTADVVTLTEQLVDIESVQAATGVVFEAGKHHAARIVATDQAELDKRQNELKAMKEEIDARGMMMTPEAKQEKMGELQKKLMEVQQLYYGLQQELSQKEAQATSGIFAKMGTLLEAIGKEAGYTIIVEKSAVLYGLDVAKKEIAKRRQAVVVAGKRGRGNGNHQVAVAEVADMLRQLAQFLASRPRERATVVGELPFP